jgi:CheY-like chemotaxis protein
LYVRFEVSDTGHGIDDDHLSKIFEPFFTTKFTGRGLGLAAVLGITRSHHGAIDVSSAPDDGATFTVYLPAKPQAVSHDSPTAPADAVPAWQGGGTVLLVDDEPAICKVGSTMLQRLGFETIVAENGIEALNIFQRQGHEIDLILLDVSMPLMDGREACSRLRAIRHDVPILLCTGYDEKEMPHEPIEGHPVGFLQKPFDMQILSTKLREALC